TELGAEVIRLGTNPDGRNINRGCGSEHPERMREVTRQTGANIGLAFDGDGDRVVVSDETGALCDGDVIMAICGRYMLETGTLAKNTVAATIMSNMGLEKALAERGGGIVRVPVGDRNVCERMVSDGLKLGGEKSGHLLFLDHHTTGDGLIAALQLLAIIQRTGKPLSELARCFEHFPQTLINVPVVRRSKLEDIPTVQDKIAAAETKLGDDGRIVVRFSGTQSLARVMVEGRDQTLIDTLAQQVAEAIKEALA
ncbi:MAG: phosphoglucosamine mutase, partial [Candidatus Hydrogenedentes bacterium]|nr:phosphoglucosamine mutase [Candidatus Hydrogenedentota bacterium]